MSKGLCIRYNTRVLEIIYAREKDSGSLCVDHQSNRTIPEWIRFVWAHYEEVSVCMSVPSAL